MRRFWSPHETRSAKSNKTMAFLASFQAIHIKYTTPSGEFKPSGRY
jgi:hypothetical protein